MPDTTDQQIADTRHRERARPAQLRLSLNIAAVLVSVVSILLVCGAASCGPPPPPPPVTAPPTTAAMRYVPCEPMQLNLRNFRCAVQSFAYFGTTWAEGDAAMNEPATTVQIELTLERYLP